MSGTLLRIQNLVIDGSFRLSEHGNEEIEEDDLPLDEIVAGLADCRIVEDYPEAWKGPSVLVLENLKSGGPIHALWGIPRHGDQVAVLITAYRPDPTKWLFDLLTRRPK